MHLTDLIRPEGIRLRLAAGDLRGALAKLVRAATAVSGTLRDPALRRALVEAPTPEAAFRLLAGADAVVRTRPPSP